MGMLLRRDREKDKSVGKLKSEAVEKPKAKPKEK